MFKIYHSQSSGTTETTSNGVVFFYFTAVVAEWVAREGFSIHNMATHIE